MKWGVNGDKLILKYQSLYIQSSIYLYIITTLIIVCFLVIITLIILFIIIIIISMIICSLIGRWLCMYNVALSHL